MERIILAYQDVEAIVTKRGYKLTHFTIDNVIKNHDYISLLNENELEFILKPSNHGYNFMSWCWLSEEEKDILIQNKAIELLQNSL